MYIVNLVKTYFLKRSTLSTLVSQELMLCKKKWEKALMIILANMQPGRGVFNRNPENRTLF